MGESDNSISLWIKIPYTLWICVHLPVYTWYHGPSNFLWFSNIAFLATGIILWKESRLWASTMAVAVVLPETGWAIGYFSNLLFDFPVFGLADYMFSDETPLWIRQISLFHFLLPPILLLLVSKLGYDERALPLQTLLAWLILPASWLVTDPDNNVNWIFVPREQGWENMPEPLWILLTMIAFPLLFYIPTHWILKKLFNRLSAPVSG